MKFEIAFRYCWYKFEDDYQIVKMYFINEVPFTFDELPDIIREDSAVVDYANQCISYTPDDLFRSSNYLILEACHPCLFEMDIKNPEELPCD
jgi:hypothetical protein